MATLASARSRTRERPSLLPKGWPDFLLPLDPATARRQITALHERAKTETVEVACYGGAGRTGRTAGVTSGGVPAGGGGAASSGLGASAGRASTSGAGC